MSSRNCDNSYLHKKERKEKMNFENVKVSVVNEIIPTYAAAEHEDLPMFAENRHHQRSSGNPYPNKVIIRARNQKKEDKEYTIIYLENEYVKIGIMPEIGGRVFSALDKKTGYDFFYKQHVIKPSFIGVFGAWISGGVEFNFPFHHRPSTFMPVDYDIEYGDDGSATVWLSEHDPMDRMKGLVGIRLEPGKSIFETRVKLANRTPLRHSFLWWENTAVPVNTDYELFFPSDVNHVYFHYRRSVASFPIAYGNYNGFKFDKEGTDISKHKNTYHSTSYFSASSEYDFFGGYDNGKKCGVVHVADHHIATGKKMFTWGYNQLSRSWGGALTDTDGAYCELMAGSYTNNQPDFSWIEPYETKCFSQYWYPIAALGAATYANTSAAIRVESGSLKVQVTSPIENAEIVLKSEGKVVFTTTANLVPGDVVEYKTPEFNDKEYEIKIGRIVYYKKEDKPNTREGVFFPEVPYPGELDTAEKRYLAGVHFKQYRCVKESPKEYFESALELDPDYTPALIALGEHYCTVGEYDSAVKMLEKAMTLLTKYNFHPESGKTSYLLGMAYLGLGEKDKAYDHFFAATWNEAYVSCGMTRIACIDGQRGEYDRMLEHSEKALSHNTENVLALALSAAAELKLGNRDAALARLDRILKNDPLNHVARYVKVMAGAMTEEEFYAKLSSSPSQTCLDVAFDLMSAGFDKEAEALLRGVKTCTDDVAPTIKYFLGESVEGTNKHKTFPFRFEEIAILESGNDESSKYLLGCLHYAARRYEKAAELWKQCTGWEALRNMAVYSWRIDDRAAAFDYLDRALEQNPKCEQLIFEIAYLMNKNGDDPKAVVARLEKMVGDYVDAREDICTEWALAYNRMGEYEKALEILGCRDFLPCEGGETALAQQYIDAWKEIGKRAYDAKDYDTAISAFRTGQVLPDNLQAGLWQDSVMVPMKYYEALCLEKLGRGDEAISIYEYIADFYVDFFSNMQMPELPCYMALSYVKMGEEQTARKLIVEYLDRWKHEMNRVTTGYFGETPFFISYMNTDAAGERKEYYTRLINMGNKVLNALNLNKTEELKLG